MIQINIFQDEFGSGFKSGLVLLIFFLLLIQVESVQFNIY
jgi:hypothetical protein